MRRRLVTVIARGILIWAASACTALALAGCGSSSGTVTTSNTGTTSANASKTSASTPSETLKADTTPKFIAPSSSLPVQSGLVQVAYRDLAIDPDALRVKVGSTIRWTNYDPNDANVVSEGGPQSFHSPTFGEGGTFEIKAEKPGVIHYECTFYPVTMNGSIEVLS